MLWGIRVIAVLILGGLSWMLLKPQPTASAQAPVQAQSTAKVRHASAGLTSAVPTVSSLNATAPVRVTVYQDTSGGVSSFSDRMDRGQPHVIDHSKGTTYQSTYRGEVPNTASLTYTPAATGTDPIDQLRHDNARFQQQVQAAKQLRVDAAIDE